MYNPYKIADINKYYGSYTPSTHFVKNNQSFDFWVRALLQRACSTIIFDNLPENWNKTGVKDFFYYCLFNFGNIGVFNIPEGGQVFSFGVPYGHNFFYQPTNYLVSNPALKNSLDLKIGEDCALIKLTPDYMGIIDIIYYYARQLSEMTSNINISLINNKFAYMIFAKSKGASEALKKAMDKIDSGESCVFLDYYIKVNPDNPQEVFEVIDRPELKNSYILTDLLADLQTIINNFDAEIGIPSMPYQKKERLVTSEAESRIIDSTSRATVWIECIKESLIEVNKLFNLNIIARLRYNPEEMKEDDEQENKQEQEA